MQHDRSQKYWLPFLLAIALALGLYIGYLMSPVIGNRPSLKMWRSSDRDNLLLEVLGLVRENYVEEPPLDSLYESALESLLSKLDPHTYYIPPKDMQEVTEEMTGNFEGIGIEFYIVRDTIQVVTPIPGGPSDLLGIQSGDKIIMVNDSLVAGIGISNEDVLKRIKGPKGTKVKISVQRQGRKELLEFNITRNTIPLYSVDGGFMINDQTGYIKVSRFSERTSEEFWEKLDVLNEQGMKNLIIDLRQNPGGYLQEAVNLLNEIMGDSRLVVYTEGRSFPREEFYSNSSASFFGRIVVLIDEGSASASEIVAGAIQDWDRGLIIGRRSFGKGLVQDQYMLRNGGALRLTIAKYYTPSGRYIQKPYTNGFQAYQADLTTRYMNGEMFHGNDSTHPITDTTRYYTKVLKRVVYAGGGIVPDIFVPLDTSYLNDFSINVLTQGLVQEYIYSYYSKGGSGLKKQYASAREFVEQFVISDAFYNQFVAYCRDKGVTNTAGAYAPEAKRYLTNRLKGFLAKQLFGNYAMLMVNAQMDDAIKKALEALSKKNMMLGI